MNKVALLTFETSCIPSFAGGLGTLTEDLFREAGKRDYPLCLISLFYPKRKKQIYENGRIYQTYIDSERGKLEKVDSLSIDSKCPAKFDVLQLREGKNFAYFLDPSCGENESWLRNMKVYGEENERQIAILRYLFGEAVPLLDEELNLGIDTWHLNESDTALAIPAIKKGKIVFTTHTSLPHGHKRINEDLLKGVYPSYPEHVMKFGRENKSINLGKLAAHHAEKLNCVSRRHYEITIKNLYPEYAFKIIPITNAVSESWINPHLREVFDNYIPDWKENESLEKVREISDRKILSAHSAAKEDLIEKMEKWRENNEVVGEGKISIDKIIGVFAKRLTWYKRPRESLRVSNVQNVNLIISGYPVEDPRILDDLSDAIHKKDNIFYILNYDKEKAKYLVSGSDFWLNLPVVGYEASGTSWMKALANGSVVFSTNDGSVPEGIKDGVNGFILDNSLSDLEEKVKGLVNIYNTEKYNEIIKNSISSSSYFLMKRCLQEYIQSLYN